MARVDARRSMARAAEEFLEARALTFTLSGRVYFEWLITRAAPEVAKEAADDESAYERAGGAVWTLLSVAAGGDQKVGTPAPLGCFLLPLAMEGGRRISAADLRAALRELCPIWPFCKRART